jgi:hypothetical protein
MPEIGDTWMPSMPFPLTDRELKEIADKEAFEKEEGREAQREKNRIKNQNRKEAKDIQKNLPKKRVEAGKRLRHAFGGAFAHAPDNVKFMAAQGTKMPPEIIPVENKEEDNE